MKAIGVVTRATDELERQISAVFIAGFVAGSFNAFFESWMFSVGNLISLLYWSATTGLIARTAWQPVGQPAGRPADLVERPVKLAERVVGLPGMGRS
jgi:hypothetical protein